EHQRQRDEIGNAYPLAPRQQIEQEGNQQAERDEQRAGRQQDVMRMLAHCGASSGAASSCAAGASDDFSSTTSPRLVACCSRPFLRPACLFSSGGRGSYLFSTSRISSWRLRSKPAVGLQTMRANMSDLRSTSVTVATASPAG